MCPAAEILVIILSIALAIFLALGIALTIYLIDLTRQIRRITASAERTVDNLGTAVTGFSRLVSPVYVAEMVAKFIKKVKKENKEDK